MILLTKKQFLKNYNVKTYALGFISKNPELFPIKTSPELARIMGSLFSDGHIGSNMVIFYSKNMYEIEDFLSLFKKAFKVDFNYKIKRVQTSHNCFGIFIFSSHLGKILELCGCPIGNKTNNSFTYHNWLKSSDLSSNFISALFDGDGSISFSKNNRIKIRFKQQKLEKLSNNCQDFLNNIRLYMREKGIKPTNTYKYGKVERKDGSISCSVEFEVHGTKSNLSNIINFRDNIGFNNIKKSNRLDNYLELLLSSSSG